jgi:hypothetical protein
MITVRQSLQNNLTTAATTVAVTFSTSVLTGSCLQVFTQNATGGGTPTISDGVNTYAQIASTLVLSYNFAQYVAKNVIGGSLTVTATQPGGSGNQFAIVVQEISGTSGLDVTGTASNAAAGQTQTAPGTGANVITTGNFTPAVQPGLISAYAWSANALPTAGTTLAFVATAGASFSTMGAGCLSEYFRYTSAAALAATFGLTASGNTASMAALFMEGASAPASYTLGGDNYF